MKNFRATLAACVTGAAMCVPTVAFSQYSISITFTPTGPAVCDSGGISQPGTGFETVILPNQSGNAYNSIALNGGPPQVSLQTIPGPYPASVPAPGGIVLPTPSPTSPPYTMVVEGFPAIQGQPTGVGIRATAVCSLSGASITIENGIPAPTPLAVPALSMLTLVTLAALLALCGAVLLRRRGGGRR